MTTKERIKAAMENKPPDRLPFWPKLDGAYANRWCKPAEYFHDMMGSDRIVGINGSFREIRSNTRYEEHSDGLINECRYCTPYGDLIQKKRFDAASQSWHPVEFPVKTRDDIEIMTAWVNDGDVVFDEKLCEKAAGRQASIGDAAYTIDNIGESSLMHFIEWLAGVENGHYLLADYPGEAEGLFDAMHKNFLKRFEVSAAYSPADCLHLTENTSTTLISPGQYEKYCCPQIRAYGDIAADKNRPFMLHMCGHLKNLLPTLGKLPVTAFEAFTPPSVGNTTLYDGRIACPDKCLIGGTNAAIWLQPADEIIEYRGENLDMLPHHRGVVVSSAGVMPPACDYEKISRVKRWVDNYPLRV